MPYETAVVLAAIIAPFVIFALALAYADYQTSRHRGSRAPNDHA